MCRAFYYRKGDETDWRITKNILRQAHQAIADVADNADSWRAFLRSAAYTTHYAFPNQALIYSQRPGATMLADIDTWNRAAGRWVNRGARGVASLAPVIWQAMCGICLTSRTPTLPAKPPNHWLANHRCQPLSDPASLAGKAQCREPAGNLWSAGSLVCGTARQTAGRRFTECRDRQYAGMGKAAGANGDFCQPHHAECRLYGGSALRFGRQRRAAGRLCGH